MLPFAAGSNEGSRELHLFGWHSGGASLRSTELSKSTGSELVRVVALDDLPEVANLHRVDVLKIDVEGCEEEVLGGASGSSMKASCGLHWSK